MSTRVLVVDGEAAQRSVIRHALTNDGCDVVEASSAEEATELFRKEPFPVVLTEISMGEMSGLELLERIKGLEPDTSVVIMTGNPSIETATDALRKGANDFLIKPFEEMATISAVVNRASEKVRLLRRNRDLMNQMKEDANELVNLNERLKAMVDRDGLTGLYNRRYFEQALDLELSRSRRHGHPFSLIFCDIDHFKHYNDTQGHLAGDEVLRSLAQIFRGACRATTVVARYGGEEFILLAPETNLAGARVLAERLRASVEIHPFVGESSQPLGKLTLSLGAAAFPRDGEDRDSLVGGADGALYVAKQSGRNRVCCCADCDPPAAAGAVPVESAVRG